jgi:hypothetical protein
MKIKKLSFALALFLGCANADKIKGFTNEADLKAKYTEIDKKLDMTSGTTEKGMALLGISDDDLVKGNVNCKDIDSKSKDAFKKASKTGDKRKVNTTRRAASQLFQGCSLQDLG